MTVYLNDQAEQYIEKPQVNSAGIFEQDGQFVAYHYNHLGEFDTDTFPTFNEAFAWLKSRR